MRNAIFIYRFNIGLVIALAAVLVSFEWKAFEIAEFKELISDVPSFPFEGEIIPITIQTPEPPPPPPPPAASIDMKIVKDIVEVKSEPVIDQRSPEIIDIPDFIEPEPIKDDVPIMVAEVSPEYPGGVKALYQYLSDQIEFDERCKDAGFEGTAHVQFVVDKKGRVKNPEILRGIGCKFVENNILKAISEMPEWKPGKQNGRAVSVYFTVPVKFTIMN